MKIGRSLSLRYGCRILRPGASAEASLNPFGALSAPRVDRHSPSPLSLRTKRIRPRSWGQSSPGGLDGRMDFLTSRGRIRHEGCLERPSKRIRDPRQTLATARSRSFLASRCLHLAAALGSVLIPTVFAGCGGAAAGGRQPEGSSSSATWYRNSKAKVAARIPGGWRVTGKPLTGVIFPTQVLAAASFPLVAPTNPRGCHPGSVLGQMPNRGVLLQVIEYVPRLPEGKAIHVPRLPPRPAHFSYRNGSFEPFECSGWSYQFAFEQGGRAFQAQVWFYRLAVDPRLRSEALQILDSFHPIGRRDRQGTRHRG